MRVDRSWIHFWSALLMFVVVSGDLAAQDHPIKLATEAYLGVKGDSAVGELTDGRAENAVSSVERMNWLPESEQRFAYFAKSPVNHFSWRELAISFAPRNAGTVTLELYGPWEKAPKGDIYRQDVWWDDVRVKGADLKDGGFEQPIDARGSMWKTTGGIRVAASAEAPAPEGKFLARTWHNERVVATFAVTAGKRVTILARARAVKPENFEEMRRIVARDTPAHKAARLLRHGVNLGNQLEVPPNQTWSLEYSDDDYDRIKAAGFDHVRLPVGWHHYTGPAPEFPLNNSIFAKVDKHLELAKKRKLAIIFNIHHFDYFTSDPIRHKDRFFAIWRQLAERYSKSPENVFFELLNEPKDAATTSVMNPIVAQVIRLIRRTNPSRTILIGPGLWNSVSELASLKLPDDDQNLIVSVHNYDPFFFTHQGASWAGPDVAVKGIRFPGPPRQPLVPSANLELKPHVRDWLGRYNNSPHESNPCGEAALREVVAMAKGWSEYYGRPIHFGEFGVFIEADAESRANYVKTFRQAFDEADLGWALWDWKAGFRYWDSEQNRPAPGFPDALFPNPKK